MNDVDFDQLARAYRHRPASEASRARAEAAGSRLEAGAWVLDVGGGPGNHAAVWSRQLLRPVVLDPSAVMLAAVRSRSLIGVRAVAQALPFSAGRFALVWFHLSIHYGDWRASINEAVRVLSEGGSIEIWTLGPDHHEQSLLARWFPSVPGIESGRFPNPELVATYLAECVEIVGVSLHVESVIRPVGEWLQAVEAGFISTLQLLSDDERDAGIAAIRDAFPDPRQDISYQLRFTRIVGMASG